jgi:glutamate N-acetyltransferase/amino-acid N-acetyltransferase
MKSSVGGLPVKGVRLGAVRAPVYKNKERDDLLLMAFDEGSIGIGY